MGLTLSRQIDERIQVGNDRTAIVQLSEEDERALRLCNDRFLDGLAKRLLNAMGPMYVRVVGFNGRDGVKLDTEVQRDVPVDREEIAIEKALEAATRASP